MWASQNNKVYGFPIRSGLEVLKPFSSSAQLSMEFQLLIDVEIIQN